MSRHHVVNHLVEDDLNVLEKVQGSLDALVAELALTKTHQLDLIEANIQSMREIAVLNRIADSLAEQHTFSETLQYTVSELAETLNIDRVWLIEPAPAGNIAKIYSTLTEKGPRENHPDDLPPEVPHLYTRIVCNKSNTLVNMLGYSDLYKDGFFGGLAITSSHNRLLAVAVFYDNDLTTQADTYRKRLLQTLLRHTAVACENARLLEVLSTMIVDVVVAMSLAIESRDPYTGGHVERVTAYAMMLGEKVGLCQRDLTILRMGGLLHDIGKVAVPDNVLRKPGKLTDDEYIQMKKHAVVGDKIVATIPQLASASPVVRWHHERFDGKGYPDGLAGKKIPLLARIAAIADTFDAMTSNRPYRKGLDIGVALKEIKRCAGSQFDPDLTKLFTQGQITQYQKAVEEQRKWRLTGHQADRIELLKSLDLGLPNFNVTTSSLTCCNQFGDKV